MATRPPSTADRWTSPERTQILRRNAERFSAASREDAELLLNAARLAPGLDVLDIGCGAGDPTLRFAERIGAAGRAVGVDLSEGALEVARERAQRAGLSNVRFQVANVEALPFPGASFDRVVSRLAPNSSRILGRRPARFAACCARAGGSRSWCGPAPIVSRTFGPRPA